MKRAARLVVDTGIHALGWTLEESMEFLMDATGCHPFEAERECRRYAAWPGQALSYKFGTFFPMLETPRILKISLN